VDGTELVKIVLSLNRKRSRHDVSLGKTQMVEAPRIESMEKYLRVYTMTVVEAGEHQGG
jgi:hypothetical protein